ncbi:hypothetical protein FGO68_gene1808 [Halteria grandinella]|uniref:Uncharacterized protein n=1 Tax=Halteria grandinella TaxID=5974 RepID=A0A8J8NJ46_HALGN|nr:hypothetical protein FGO68_gene1808 [Halteria grandinella]
MKKVLQFTIIFHQSNMKLLSTYLYTLCLLTLLTLAHASEPSQSTTPFLIYHHSPLNAPSECECRMNLTKSRFTRLCLGEICNKQAECDDGMVCINRLCTSSVDKQQFCNQSEAAQCGKCDRVECNMDWECGNKECSNGKCYNNAYYMWLCLSVIITIFVIVIGGTIFAVIRRGKAERRKEMSRSITSENYIQ